jgi:hypothetical protein
MYYFVMKIKVYSYLSPFLLLFSTFSTFSVLAHVDDVKTPSAIETGKWHKKELTVKWDSNWSTEHCMDISTIHTMEYRWLSEHAMKYDFHVHPNNKNNEYQTDYFSKSESIKDDAGKITTTKPGTYCFNFFPVNRLKANSKIELLYRLD